MDRASAVADDWIDTIKVVFGVKLEPLHGPTLCQHHLGELLIRIGQPCHDNGFEAEAAKCPLKSVHCVRNLGISVQSFNKIKRLPAILCARHGYPSGFSNQLNWKMFVPFFWFFLQKAQTSLLVVV